VLFVDEYQDLGRALHELVLLLCFQSDIRLFAVGDADQSIYGFTGANPQLLQSLTLRHDVATIRLRLNYRCGTKIISASMAALGEDRDYEGPDGAVAGDIYFNSVNGGLEAQAAFVATNILPALQQENIALEQIAVLYREAWMGDKVAEALQQANIPFVRADANALVPRSSRLARFVEACAQWVTGGWKYADPSYQWILNRACDLTFGPRYSEAERLGLSDKLILFLTGSIDTAETTHTWLQRIRAEIILPWRSMGRNPSTEWSHMETLVQRTSLAEDGDMPLAQFSGKQSATGRVNLSTLHSSKGREFDAVALFAMNSDVIPKARDNRSVGAMREARRLFYVGVTRPRRHLFLVFQNKRHSPWVAELFKRLNPPANTS
jgi:DNA helicase-2/ATP-dependent DNA helicase PcrA